MILAHALATNDGPVHLAFSNLLLSMHEPGHPMQQQAYTVHLHPNPNLVVYLLMARLMRFFSASFVESVVQILCIAGPIAAGYFALRMIQPKNAWLAIFLLPIVGLWAMIATLRAGFAHQRLARLAREEGMELDTSTLPRRPSGRIEREAADELFDTVRAEVEDEPDDWRRWYRLARAYDYAGDRGRARETMRKAVDMERAAR